MNAPTKNDEPEAPDPNENCPYFLGGIGTKALTRRRYSA